MAERHVRIISTGFWNEAQPLGSVTIPVTSQFFLLTRAPAKIDAIELGKQPFAGIEGRQNEFVFAPDGRPIAALNQIPREVQNLIQVQVVQEALDCLIIRIRALPQFGDKDRARLIENIRSKVPRTMELKLELAEELECTPQGKTPFIIRRVSAPAEFSQSNGAYSIWRRAS